MRHIKIIFIEKNLNTQQSIAYIFKLVSTCINNCLLFSNLKLNSLLSPTKVQNYNNIKHFLGSVNDIIILDQTNINSDYILSLFDSLSLNGTILLIFQNDSSHFHSHLVDICHKLCVETYSFKNFDSHNDLFLFLKNINPPLETINKHIEYKLSEEQQKHSDYIENKILTNNDFIIWLSGNRGTGKSYTCSHVVNKIVDNNVICGGLFANINSIKYLYPEFSSNFINITFDNFMHYINVVDTLIIEEASSIPIAILTDILKAYKKIVIVSTNIGYEGSARGLSIQLKDQFNIEELSLNHRYRNLSDSAENFLHNIFFYKQENNNLINSITYKQDSNITYNVYKFKELLKQSDTISYISSLLQQYHYQQTLNDIVRWINNNTYISIASVNNNSIIGVVIFSIEQVETDELIDDIYNGRRLPKNNLFPQVMLAQLGIKLKKENKFARIERIVVQKNFQQHNIGTSLLTEATEFLRINNIDYLGAAFGIKLHIVNFWLKNDFLPIHISYNKDNASGLRSLFVIKSLKIENLDNLLFIEKLAHLKIDIRMLYENLNEEISYVKPFNMSEHLELPSISHISILLANIKDLFTKEEFNLFNLHIKNIIYAIAFHNHLVEISIFEIRYFYYICIYSNIINKNETLKENKLYNCVIDVNFFINIKENRKQIISEIRMILQKLWLELYERKS